MDQKPHSLSLKSWRALQARKHWTGKTLFRNTFISKAEKSNGINEALHSKACLEWILKFTVWNNSLGYTVFITPRKRSTSVSKVLYPVTKEIKNYAVYETTTITNDNTELRVVIQISCNCVLFYRYGLWMTLDFYVQAPMATDFSMIKRLKFLLTVFIVFSTKINGTIFA